MTGNPQRHLWINSRCLRRLVIVTTVAYMAVLPIAVPDSGAISGGVTGVAGEAPWAVRLETTGGSPFCSGVLISARVVVTAKHCTATRAASSIRVRFPSGGTRTAVSKREANTVDIAVLQLSSSVSARPVHVSRNEDTLRSFINRGVTFYGWGRTSANSGLSSVVRKTPDGSWRGAQYCQSWFGPEGTRACFLKTRTLAQDGVALFPGDSGGAWVGWVGGRWVLLAVERGGISLLSPSSRGPEGGPSVAAPRVRRWLIDNSWGAVT